MQPPDPMESYYAVIPSPVLLDEGISDKAKILYAHITTLARSTGYCFGSNQYLADKHHCDQRTISRRVSELVNRGYISVEIVKDDQGQITGRLIYLGSLSSSTGQKCRGSMDKNVVSFKCINNINTPSDDSKAKRKSKTTEELDILQLREVFAGWITQVGDSWPKDTKNQVFAELMAFYSPRAVKQGKLPVKSKMGVSRLCNKLERHCGSDADAILDALQTAIAAGWTTVWPERHGSARRAPHGRPIPVEVDEL